MSGESVELAEGAHQVEVRNLRDWALFDYVQVVPLAVPQVKNFPDWQRAHFSEDEIADTSISAWSAAPVGDGVVNLLKYALGLDPWAAAGGGVVELSQDAGKASLTYSRPAALTDVSYIAEASDDSSHWLPVIQKRKALRNGIETLQAAEADSPHHFMRLRVTCGPWTASTESLPASAAGAGGNTKP